MREGLRSNSRRPAALDRRMIDLNKVPIEAEEEDVGAASSAYYSAQGEPVEEEDVSSNAVGGDVGLGQGVDADKSLDVGVTVPTIDVAAASATGVEVEDQLARPRTRGRKRKMESSALVPVKEENVVSDAYVGGIVTAESGPRRRGRKRKEGRSEAGQEATCLGSEATERRTLRSRMRMEVTPQTEGRVLRSRARREEAAAAADKQASLEKEADAAEKHTSPDKEAAADKLVLPGKQPDSADKLDFPEKEAVSTEMQALPEKEADFTEIQALPEKEADAADMQALPKKEDHSDMELESPRPTEEGKTPAEKESQLVIGESAAAPADKESQLVTEEVAGVPAERKLKRGRGRPPKRLGVDGSALLEKEELEIPRLTEEGKTHAEKESRLVIGENAAEPAEKESQLVTEEVAGAPAEKESQLVIGESAAAPADKESQLVTEEVAGAPAERKLKRGRGRPPKKLGVDGSALLEKEELEIPRLTEEGKTHAEKESRLVIGENAAEPAEKESQLVTEEVAGAPAEKESQLVIGESAAAPADKESQLVTEEVAGAPAERKLKRGRGRPPKKLGVDGSALLEKEELESPRLTEEGKTHAEKESRLVIGESAAEPAEKESKLVTEEVAGAPARKKLKRGRGRPPKKLGVGGSALLEKEDYSDMELKSPRPTEEGKTPAEKESRLVTEEVAGAPADKKLKRGRGRPLKNLGVDGSAKVTDTVSHKAQIDLQKKISMPGAKLVKGQKGVKLHKVVTAVKFQSQNNIEKKEGGVGMSLKEEKNILREQITAILINAGWTVEYRPRQGRDYNDAVYLDAQGKTHWSVTLAYSRLEKKVAEGTADEKEVAAFIPIPQDRLCILFRVTKGVSKSKKDEDGSGSSRKKTDGLKGEKLSKRKVKGEQEKSSSRKPTSRKGGSRRPCGLSAREAKVELEDGKLTVLSWMIDLETVSPGDKVQYMNHERTHEGKIFREGICCDCCGQVFSLADFEVHIGSSRGQPLLNICLESGRSLLQCMSESWSKQEQIHRVGYNFVNVEDDPDDDTCNVCADGGDLICCDGCPSTFHQSCLQIENFPTGDWHCIYCACKYCGIICNENSEGSNVRDPDDSGYLTCLFCEEKFHVKCMLRKEKKNILEELQFCSSGCQKLSENLNKLLGVKHELENGFSLTILRRQDLSTYDPLKIECNSKLAMAYAILNECFNPINDERSSTNMIQNICYSCGSNVRRLNYSGFCTFLMEKNDELIAAATIRIHGNQLAEMPFIGTRGIYRRKGMCRRLLTAIETVLSSLDVEKLIIPAISELLETWTKVFGFVPFEESQRQGVKHMSLVLFPHMDLLQKPMHKDQAKEGETSAAAGTDCSQPISEHMNAKGSPTHYTPAASVGYEPHRVNRLVDSITSKDELYRGFGTSEATSKSGAHTRNFNDEVFHGLDKYEASLDTSKSVTLEGSHVEHRVCAHDDGKEVLQSSQKSAVC